MKPFSESCEQNKNAILQVLRLYVTEARASAFRVLEIGSGTGQHAVYFAEQCTSLQWQCSDLPANHSGIQAWIDEAGLANVGAPITLDVNQAHWTEQRFDMVFSANSTHIMDWNSVENLFAGVPRVLKPGGVFLLYGPFNYNGRYSSDSNARFDQWLKARDPLSGVRDFEALHACAQQNQLQLLDDHAMPANNRCLVWIKQSN